MNGKTFPAEIHFVTWNKGRYNSALQSLEHPDGIAVLAYFVDIGTANEEFAEVFANLHKILYYNGGIISGLKPIDLDKFLHRHFLTCIKFSKILELLICSKFDSDAKNILFS